MGRGVPNVSKQLVSLRMSDDALRTSIIQVGCLLPVLRFGARTIDGHRRQRIAAGVGKDVRIVEFRSRSEAARALWMLHPERALSLFPEPTLQEAADLYGTSPAQVALIRRQLSETPPPYQHERRSWTRRRTIDLAPYQTEGRACKVQFWISPELRESMRLARAAMGKCTEAAFIRRAIQSAIRANQSR
jgi:hypothetical protein